MDQQLRRRERFQRPDQRLLGRQQWLRHDPEPAGQPHGQQRQPLLYDAAGGFTDVTTVSSTGAAGYGTALSPFVNHVVNNAARAYGLNWQPNQTGASMQLCGLRVAYRVAVSTTYLPAVIRRQGQRSGGMRNDISADEMSFLASLTILAQPRYNRGRCHDQCPAGAGPHAATCYLHHVRPI